MNLSDLYAWCAARFPGRNFIVGAKLQHSGGQTYALASFCLFPPGNPCLAEAFFEISGPDVVSAIVELVTRIKTAYPQRPVVEGAGL